MDQIVAWSTVLAPLRGMREAACTEPKEKPMANYRIVYGDDEQVVRETYNDVDLEREDGWLVLFRDNDAILRIQEAHVQSLEQVDGTT